MTKFRVYNSQFQTIPHPPFDTLDEAKRRILTLLETYNGPFYVEQLNIVHVQEK